MRNWWLKIGVGVGVLLGAGRIQAADLLDPSAVFYVQDQAQVLSEQTRELIVTQSGLLAEQTGAQIVVVTLESLAGQDSESYATELFRAWGIGAAEKDSGLLILLAVAERDLRVEVGYGLEGILPDGKVGRLLDETMMAALREDRFDEAVRAGYEAFYQEVWANREEIGVNEQDSQAAEDFWLTVIGLVFLGVFIYWGSKQKGGGGGGALGYVLGSMISSGWGSGGGGSLGGARGGGGSSGGAGASRSF